MAESDRPSEPEQEQRPGGDGNATQFPADSFAVELGYYPGDYIRSSSSLDSSSSTGLHGMPLYSGNISSVSSNIGKTTGARYEQLSGEVYRYDQLDRLKTSDFRFYSSSTWNTTTQYATRYSYDANGNIDSIMRRAYDTLSSNRMDSMRLFYSGNTNRLNRAVDAVTGDPYKEDINSGQTGSNYRLDNSGNLVEDVQEKLTMTWDAGGRIRRVEKRPAMNRWTIIEYRYDALGNRVYQKVTDHPVSGATTIATTMYVNDPTGEVQAIYTQRCDSGDTCSSYHVEYPMYGMGREGIATSDSVELGMLAGDTTYTRRLGQKLYELT